MGVFTFENQGAYSFLVYELDKDDVIDSLSLGMITGNKIPGFAQAVFTQMDDKKFIKYNISKKVTVDQFFLGSVNRKRLLGVFSSLASAFISAEDYMIDSDSLLLDLKDMYADVSSCAAVLICLPVIQTEKQPMDLHKFFKNIMFSTQFDQTENCDYIGKILNYLNGSAQFSVVEFKHLLDGLSEHKSAPKPVQQNTVPRSVISQPQVQIQVSSAQPLQAALQTVIQEKPQIPEIQQPSIPVSAASKQPSAASAYRTNAAPQQEEKIISGFYLLQHYNKENADTYKAQQAKKKSAKSGKATAPAKQPSKSQQPAAYAIPGAPQQLFAVPGPASQQVQENTKTPSANQPQMTVPPSLQQVYMPRQEMVQQSASFGETTVLGGGPAIGETSVLGMETYVEVKPYLIRLKNNERIMLNKPVFRIGKEKSYADYFIGDNTAVSRSHASIISRGSEYFIMDTNSTNHTYVSGQIIPSNVEVKIVSGTRIQLANEDFEFRI